MVGALLSVQTNEETARRLTEHMGVCMEVAETVPDSGVEPKKVQLLQRCVFSADGAMTTILLSSRCKNALPCDFRPGWYIFLISSRGGWTRDQPRKCAGKQLVIFLRIKTYDIPDVVLHYALPEPKDAEVGGRTFHVALANMPPLVYTVICNNCFTKK